MRHYTNHNIILFLDYYTLNIKNNSSSILPTLNYIYRYSLVMDALFLEEERRKSYEF